MAIFAALLWRAALDWLGSGGGFWARGARFRAKAPTEKR